MLLLSWRRGWEWWEARLCCLGSSSLRLLTDLTGQSVAGGQGAGHWHWVLGPETQMSGDIWNMTTYFNRFPTLVQSSEHWSDMSSVYSSDIQPLIIFQHPLIWLIPLWYDSAFLPLFKAYRAKLVSELLTPTLLHCQHWPGVPAVQ